MMTNESVSGAESAYSWTDEQLAIIHSVPRAVHFVLGLYVSLVGIVGFAANGLILVTYFKYNSRLRTPTNIFVVNMAASDLTACALHWMGAYSNFNGEWAFGRLGCQLYGGGIGTLGVVSILVFSAVAFERYLVIGQQPVGQTWRITCSRAKVICAVIWLWCGVIGTLPLVGVSSYVPEGILTTCTWDYTTRTESNRIYYVVFLVTGFVIPVGVVLFSYGSILLSVCRQARQMVTVTPEVSALRKLRRNAEIKTSQIVIVTMLVYLTAWTPYAVVTLIGQFGPEGYLSAAATATPAFFAKLAVVVDPLVYGFSHPHFRASFRHYWAVLSRRTNRVMSIAEPDESLNRLAPTSTTNPSQLTLLDFQSIHHHRQQHHERRMLRNFRSDSTVADRPAITEFGSVSFTASSSINPAAPMVRSISARRFTVQ